MMTFHFTLLPFKGLKLYLSKLNLKIEKNEVLKSVQPIEVNRS